MPFNHILFCIRKIVKRIKQKLSETDSVRLFSLSVIYVYFNSIFLFTSFFRTFCLHFFDNLFCLHNYKKIDMALFMVINTYTEGHVDIKDLLIVTGSSSTACLILNNIACIYIYFPKFSFEEIQSRICYSQKIRMLAYCRHHLSIGRSNCRRQYN